MIIYGRKRVPQAQQLSAPIQCPHCLQTAPILVVGCAEYFHLYGIPFFGWKRAVYLCSDCQMRLVATGSTYAGDLPVKIPPEVRAVYDSLASQVRKPWYHFFGLILVAVAIVVFMLQG